MLHLDDERWRSLTHAYGSAVDVPRMVQDLAREPTLPGSDKVWTDVWSALCHQGTVYSATYAAVPHLVAIAEHLPPTARREYIYFVGAVAASTDHAHPVPAELDDDYFDALGTCLEHAEAALAGAPGDWHRTLYLLVALSALRGCKRAAAVLERLADRELLPTCPACGGDIYVTVDDQGWYVTADDPVRGGEGQRTQPSGASERRPAAAEEWTDANAPRLLSEYAEASGQAVLAEDLHRIEGSIACPRCHATFAMYERLVEMEKEG